MRIARRAGGVFSLENGIDVYRTAVGAGWSMQVSMIMRHFHQPLSEIRKMDEMQIANRVSDLPKLLRMERRHMALAMWGPKKGTADEDGDESKAARRKR